jgi:hypothetical protein
MTHHKYRFAGNKITSALRCSAIAPRQRSFHFSRMRARQVQLAHSSSRLWPARPQDAERLAALDHWAALYASDGSSPEQITAAMRSARAAREISSLRSHQMAVMASIDFTHLDPKTRSMLVELARQQRFWQALQRSALDYLEQAAADR